MFGSKGKVVQSLRMSFVAQHGPHPYLAVSQSMHTTPSLFRTARAPPSLSRTARAPPHTSSQSKDTTHNLSRSNDTIADLLAHAQGHLASDKARTPPHTLSHSKDSTPVPSPTAWTPLFTLSHSKDTIPYLTAQHDHLPYHITRTPTFSHSKHTTPRTFSHIIDTMTGTTRPTSSGSHRKHLKKRNERRSRRRSLWEMDFFARKH